MYNAAQNVSEEVKKGNECRVDSVWRWRCRSSCLRRLRKKKKRGGGDGRCATPLRGEERAKREKKEGKKEKKKGSRALVSHFDVGFDIHWPWHPRPCHGRAVRSAPHLSTFPCSKHNTSRGRSHTAAPDDDDDRGLQTMTQPPRCLGSAGAATPGKIRGYGRAVCPQSRTRMRSSARPCASQAVFLQFKGDRPDCSRGCRRRSSRSRRSRAWGGVFIAALSPSAA